MARSASTLGKRNVILVLTQKPDGTWQGRGVEIQTDGTLALGTAKTSTAERGDLLKQLVGDFATGGTTPEHSALYSHHEILTVIEPVASSGSALSGSSTTVF